MFTRRLQGCSLLLLLLLVFLLYDATGGLCEGETEEGRRRSLATGSGLFCVARQGADPTALQIGLNYACGPGHADCSAIQPGGVCYQANNLPALASYAYNDYYHRNAATGATCIFNGTATTTPNDPSSGQCIFAGSSMAGGSSTPGASAPTSFVPPASTSTPGFGGSPAGTFNPGLDAAADRVMSGARWALCVLLLPLFFV